MPESTVGSSSRISVAKMPTCSTAVLENVTPMMKLRCFIAIRRQAVATNWALAPRASQPR